MSAVDHHFLGHPTAGEQGANAVAYLPGRARPDLADHPGAFQSEHLTGTGRRWVKPGFLQQIGPIKACCRYTDANLPCITRRTWFISPYHLAFNALQCFHGASIVSLDWARCCYTGLSCIMRPGHMEPATSKTA